MDGVDADEATKWVESLTEEEAKLANSKDFENALEEQKKKLNGASLSADDYAAALQAVKDNKMRIPKKHRFLPPISSHKFKLFQQV